MLTYDSDYCIEPSNPASANISSWGTASFPSQVDLVPFSSTIVTASQPTIIDEENLFSTVVVTTLPYLEVQSWQPSFYSHVMIDQDCLIRIYASLEDSVRVSIGL